MNGSEDNLEFDFAAAPIDESHFKAPLGKQLGDFREFGTQTRLVQTQAQLFTGQSITVPTYVNEFWTAKQRAASSLHEISYRACFKPQLPRFFIQRLTEPGDVVYDPFMGRGTTVVETALLNRIPRGCDINPLSVFLTKPRLEPPSVRQVDEWFDAIDWRDQDEFPEDLLVFYHPETLREICALKKFLLRKKADGALDNVDRWIWMVGLNRLTGHSPGFFSVYTLPPNQAVSFQAQQKINADRNQKPPRRNVAKSISKKTSQLLSDCGHKVRESLTAIAKEAILLTADSSSTPQIGSGTVSLIVTSPPFLDVVDYASDNWLRCWFIGVDPEAVALTVPKKLGDWQKAMTAVFQEMFRVLRPGGHVAFEVGEVRGGKIRLEEAVLPCGVVTGFEPLLVLINDQKFTKTANCWGVDNNFKGTNTNRVVVFRKPG
jgi:hypothetical protein